MQNYSYVVEIFEKVQPCNHMLIFSTLGAILPFIPNALFSTIIMSYRPFHFLAKMVSLCPMNHYVSIDASRWYKNTIQNLIVNASKPIGNIQWKNTREV
jgi:hypothetical protein